MTVEGGYQDPYNIDIVGVTDIDQRATGEIREF